MIVDGHLDLAWNHLRGRDQTLDVHALREHENTQTGRAMVTLPELRKAGVAVAFASIYVGPIRYDGDEPVYDPPARDQALAQLDCYRRWRDEGLVRIVTDRASLGDVDPDGPTSLVLSMESADPIDSPDDLPWWVQAGVRIIGPAWAATRYSGGTGRPGPLTPLGQELIHAMREHKVILDTAHLAEEAFFGALELEPHRAVCTHANCRTFVSGDRQLSDQMLAALASKDGVVGLVPYNGFLVEGWNREGPQPSLQDLERHLAHAGNLIGWDRVAIGSDLDGGFGREETPDGLDTIADLHKIGDLVPPDARDGVLHGNWLRVLRESLP